MFAYLLKIHRNYMLDYHKAMFMDMMSKTI